MLLQHPMLQQYLLNYELPYLAWICISSMIIREWLLHLQGIWTGKHLPFWILQPMTLASNSHQDSGHPNLWQEPLRDTRIYWPESIDFASSNTEAIDCLPWVKQWKQELIDLQAYRSAAHFHSCIWDWFWSRILETSIGLWNAFGGWVTEGPIPWFCLLSNLYSRATYPPMHMDGRLLTVRVYTFSLCIRGQCHLVALHKCPL